MTKITDKNAQQNLLKISGRVGQISEEMKDLKLRLSDLVHSTWLIVRAAQISEENRRLRQASIERISKRLDRIESRLSLESDGKTDG